MTSKLYWKVYRLRDKPAKEILAELEKQGTKTTIQSVYNVLKSINNEKPKQEVKPEEKTENKPEENKPEEKIENKPTEIENKIDKEPHKLIFNVEKEKIDTIPLKETEQETFQENDNSEQKENKEDLGNIKLSRLFEKIPNVISKVFKHFNISELSEEELKQYSEDYKELADAYVPSISANPKIASATNVGIDTGLLVVTRLDEIIPKIKNIKSKEIIQNNREEPKQMPEMKVKTTITEKSNSQDNPRNLDSIDAWLMPAQKR